MLKVLLVVFAAVISAASAGSVITAAYAGTTIGNPTWNPPDVSTATPPVCTAQSTTAVTYANFTVGITNPGVYQVKCMFENAFTSGAEVYVYSGASDITGAAACTNFVKKLGNVVGLDGGPIIDDAVFMPAGDFTFYVTGSSSTAQGIFACQVKAPTYGGSTQNSTLLVLPVTSSQESTCSSGSTEVPADSFSFNQTTTGLYDINIYFANTSFPGSSFGANAALYMGPSPLNATGISDLCGYPTVTVIAGYFSVGEFAISLQNVTLTAGANYTVVLAGGDQDSKGYWAATIDPTIVGTTNNSPGKWTQPQRNFVDACQDSSSTDTFTYVYTFIAEGQTYILDTQRLDWGTYLDTYSFLYAGLNNATVPNTCGGLLFGGDSGDVTPIAFQGLIINNTYTIVVSSYSGSSSATGDFGLYAFTGIQLGVIPPPPTTGQPTTGAVSGVSTTTATQTPTQPTSAASTTTSGVASSTEATTTSGAMQIGVSAVLLLVAAFLAFF